MTASRCWIARFVSQMRWQILFAGLLQNQIAMFAGFSRFAGNWRAFGLNGMTGEDGKPLYTDYADYIINHQRKPGIGPLAGFRGEDGHHPGAASLTRTSWMPISIMVVSGWKKLPEAARFYKHANQDYQDWAVEMGFFDAPQPVIFQLWLEPLAKFQLAANGHGEHIPPDHIKEQIKNCFDPLPDWYAPFEGELLDKPQEFPYHAITQRPAAMYHSWGSQNSWLRQIHTKNPLYVPGLFVTRQGWLMMIGRGYPRIMAE